MEANNASMIEYIIKLDTAKEMAMLERNDKGKQVRKYFIEIEKKYKENLMVIPKDYSSALRLAADEYDKRMIAEKELNKANRQLEIQKPFVQTALKLQNTDDTVSMEQAAKFLSDNGIDIGRNTLMKVLREHGILMGNNSPYEKYKKQGYLK